MDEVMKIEEVKPHVQRMQAPEGCTGVSVAGMSFEVPKDGVVECSAAVAHELRSHGFTDYVEKKAAKKRAQVAADD